MVGYLFWDPNRFMFDFTIPILNRPILWYGFLFAMGFFLGYLICRYLVLWYLMAKPLITSDDITSVDILSQIVQQHKQEGVCCFKSLNSREMSSKEVFSRRLSDLFSKTSPSPTKLSSSLYSFFTKFLTAAEKNLFSWRVYFEDLFGLSLVTLKQKALHLTESMSFLCVIGVVVGARLGDVIFYQEFTYYIKDPITILQIWKGGLSSHGGAIGALIAIWVFSRKKRCKDVGLSFLRIADIVTIPTALLGSFIRVGNFINQEILGTQASVPWAVVFGHPADGSVPVPRHPVQLYEALIYFLIFLTLTIHWKGVFRLVRPGLVLGWFLLAVFSSRFVLEFFKTEQSDYLIDQTHLHMGQYLSLPFILLGLYLVFFRKKLNAATSK